MIVPNHTFARLPGGGQTNTYLVIRDRRRGELGEPGEPGEPGGWLAIRRTVGRHKRKRDRARRDGVDAARRCAPRLLHGTSDDDATFTRRDGRGDAPAGESRKMCRAPKTPATHSHTRGLQIGYERWVGRGRPGDGTAVTSVHARLCHVSTPVCVCASARAFLPRLVCRLRLSSSLLVLLKIENVVFTLTGTRCSGRYKPAT